MTGARGYINKVSLSALNNAYDGDSFLSQTQVERVLTTTTGIYDFAVQTTKVSEPSTILMFTLVLIALGSRSFRQS